MPLDYQHRWGTTFTLWGFYHPDGWVLWPTGYTETAPADIEHHAGDRYWFSPSLGAAFYEWEFMRPGGNVYYDPEIGFARNSRINRISMVGLPSLAFSGTRGYDTEWTNQGPVASGVQNRWLVTVTVMPDGLGEIFAGHPRVMPVWAGKIYPQWPPLRRGRQPLNP
jgi:hypothetical protein